MLAVDRGLRPEAGPLPWRRVTCSTDPSARSFRPCRRSIREYAFSEFENEDLHQSAILKSVEFIGETVSRIGEETKAKHPDIPWTETIGMRNLLVKGYLTIRLGSLLQMRFSTK